MPGRGKCPGGICPRGNCPTLVCQSLSALMSFVVRLSCLTVSYTSKVTSAWFYQFEKVTSVPKHVRQEVATQLVTLLALTTATQFSLAFLREYWRLCNVYKNDCSTCAQSRSTGGRIIPALQQSNWLPIKCRIIIIKIATLLHHILHNCSAVRRTSPTWLRSTRHTRNVS